MKNLITVLFVSFAFAIGFIACEKEFSPKFPDTADDIVVEGYIESGKDATPPYVILTKSLPFFKELNGFGNAFVEGADVWVSNGKDSVKLQELCWKNLTPDLKKQAALAFGIDLDSVTANFNFCVYLDLAQRMKGEIGKTYNLRIKTKEGVTMTASTKIPRAIPIDTGFFIKPPGVNKLDSFAQMRVTFTDLVGGPDYYRYFTAVNGSSYIAGASSVADDAFVDGLKTTLNLNRSEPRGKQVSLDTFGLFRRGDTVSIKFCNIDQSHFDFWNTLEFNANNGGPFASYTRVKHNIKGGLGIWGGYAATYYTTVVPKK
jgi:Domain of unknown function (DUF4249)